jgi:hypothetical protein
MVADPLYTLTQHYTLTCSPHNNMHYHKHIQAENPFPSYNAHGGFDGPSDLFSPFVASLLHPKVDLPYYEHGGFNGLCDLFSPYVTSLLSFLLSFKYPLLPLILIS